MNSPEVDKVCNTILYLVSRLSPPVSKIKILKLLNILDEHAVKCGGIPFLNLKYEVWQYGPVCKNIYVDLTEGEQPNLLGNYLEKYDGKYFRPKKNVTFNDDEFSDNDIALMDKIIEQFKCKSAWDLVDYTHQKDSLWYKTAKRENVLEKLQNKEISTTSYTIDFADLLVDDPLKKSIYTEYCEMHPPV